MIEQHRDRIAAAFDRELARSPVPPSLRTEVIRGAVERRGQAGPRRQWALALVAVLLAGAIVATLVGVRVLHLPSPSPAKHGLPVALLHNGYLVVAEGNSLVAIDPTTGSRRTLLVEDVPLSDAAYSPDGSRLAYIKDQQSIWILNAATGRTSQLTTCSCEASSHLSWSPDGSRLVYSVGSEPAGAQLDVVKADGTHRTQLTHFPAGDYPWQPTWAPDGTRIAFALRDSGGIDVINADGSGLTVLLAGAGGQDPGFPAWSPDGSKVAYIADPVNPPGTQGPFEYQLWVMDADGSHRNQIFVSQGCCVTAWGGPAWSPDATQIATITSNTLWVMNVDGSDARSLGATSIGGRPTWQPLP